MHHRSPVASASPGVGGVEPAVAPDQVPRWSDPDQHLHSPSSPTATGSEALGSSFLFPACRFPVDPEYNSNIYLWRGSMADFPGFEAHVFKLPDAAEMPPHADAGERLRGAEIQFRGEVQGPESVAFDLHGREPYTSVSLDLIQLDAG